MKTSLQHQSLESLPVVLLPKQPESMWEGSLCLACKVIIMTRVIGVFDLKLTIPLKPPVKMHGSYHLFVGCVCCLTEMRNYLKNLNKPACGIKMSFVFVCVRFVVVVFLSHFLCALKLTITHKPKYTCNPPPQHTHTNKNIHYAQTH